jgi:hypothetical protein
MLDDQSFKRECLTNNLDYATSLVQSSAIQEFINNLNSSNAYDLVKSDYYTTDQFNNCFKTKANVDNLSIFHLNIRSLNCNNLNLKLFLSQINTDFDIIALSEIWSYNIQFYANLFGSEKYDYYYEIPPESSIGGVAVYIKKTLQGNLRSDLHISFYPNYKCENLWLEFSFLNSTYIIAAMYNHPKQKANDFFQKLEPSLHKVVRKGHPCIIVGDININLLKYSSNSDIAAYLTNIVSYNFLPIMLLPTRITSNSCTLIDHIYLFEGTRQRPYLDISCGNFICDISDHLANFILLHNRCTSKKTIRPSTRIFSDRNKNKFHAELLATDWESALYSTLDVETAFSAFTGVLQDAFKAAFPLVRMSKKAVRDKEWVTATLKEYINKKNFLYKVWITSNSTKDKKIYLSYKKTVTKLIKKARCEYYSKQFSNKINDAKLIWKQINELFSIKKAKSSSQIRKITINGAEVENENLMPVAFNEYFCSIGAKLAEKFNNNNADPMAEGYKQFLDNPVQNTIFCEAISEQEIAATISMIKPKKSSGPDELPMFLFKDFVHTISPHLSFLFNLSLDYGIVPNSQKIAKVVPIFKKGDSTLVANYRPISLLNSMAKILEKVIANRLSSFLTKYNIIYDFQFGFRKHHSTTLSVLEVIDECYNKLNQNNYVLGIYFDLQKAFDSVTHSILLDKLEYYGIRGKLFNWFVSYLSNRQQFTVVNGVSSSVLPIAYGVPQGSVLGPLLFLLYINDIFKAVDNSKLRLFADDTNLFVFEKTISALETTANNSVQSLQHWFYCNKLTVNVDKTNMTLFNTKRGNTSPEINVVLGGNPIAHVNECKYLGIVIDVNLKWNVHVDSIVKCLVKFTSLFYKLRVILPAATIKQLYFALVYSKLLYGLEVYGCADMCVLDPLIKLNNKILRICQFQSIDCPLYVLYDKYNTLPLPALYEFQLSCLMHKLLHCKNILPPAIQNFLTVNSSIHSHNTRQKNNLHLFTISNNFGSKSIAFNGSKLWNGLTDALKNMTSFPAFKRSVKAHVRDSYFSNN